MRFQYQTPRYEQCCAQALPSVTLFMWFWAEFVIEGYDSEYPEQRWFCPRAPYVEGTLEKYA